MKFGLDATLGEVKQYLKANWIKGTHCPACNQSVKLYQRPLTSSMAYGLILLARENSAEDGWIHIENYFKELNIPSSIRGDISKLVNWKMLERFEGTREDGSNRVGVYRVTENGRRFVRGQLQVYSHILIYNNEFKGFTGNLVGIKEALGKKFNYNELMGND
jgi:hypothetical protein